MRPVSRWFDFLVLIHVPKNAHLTALEELLNKSCIAPKTIVVDLSVRMPNCHETVIEVV